MQSWFILFQLYSDFEQAQFMEMFSKLPLPGSYTKHISYLDFDYFNELTKMPQVQDILENKTFKYKRPIFVNMVREPINRVISWYYYIRAPWYIIEPNKNGTRFGEFLNFWLQLLLGSPIVSLTILVLPP